MLGFFRPVPAFLLTFTVMGVHQTSQAGECITKDDQVAIYGYSGLDDDITTYVSARSDSEKSSAEQVLLAGLDRTELTKFGKRTYLDALANLYVSQDRFDDAIAALRRINNENLAQFKNEDSAITARTKDMEKSKTTKRAKPIVRFPVYPKKVKKSAHCWFTFDVSTKGQIENVEELYCTDKKLKKDAKQTIEKFKYSPAFQDGKRVADTGITTKVTFRLMDECGMIIPEIEIK